MSTDDTSDYWGPMPDEYTTVPGLVVLTNSRILDWYDGPLLFRGESADGSVWLCSSVDVRVTPEHGIDWTEYVDAWAYVRHGAATVEDILANRRPYRDLFTAGRELYRVEVTWQSTGGPKGQSAPVTTWAPSTPETIVDGWLPPEDHYFRIDLPPSPCAP